MTDTPHTTTPVAMVPECLAGGLPLLCLPRQGPELLSARLAIRGGSSLDPCHGRGAHQLLAGLMTRGCGDLDAEALADRVEGAGAALRAEAHEDALVVGLTCAAEDATALLPLVLTMVRRPQLAADQLELERQLNLQTLQRQREDPFQVGHDRLRQLLYGDGPYGHDPLGDERDLRGLERRHLQELVVHLGDQGAVLVLCGSIPEDCRQQLEQELALAPWTTRRPTAGAPTIPATGEGGLGLEEQDTEQLVLMLGSASVPMGHPDAVALRLIQAHLGLGMSSRLFVVMREERGLAYDVGVHLPARSGPAPFVLHLSSSAERAAEATACLLAEWQRLLDTALSRTELELALAKLRGQDAMGRQTCSQIAERMALILGQGLPPDQVERTLTRAAALTPADLQDAAQRWLASPSLSLVGPTEALQAAEAVWERQALR